MNTPITWNDDLNKVEGNLDKLARWKRPDLAPGTCAWARNLKEEISVFRFVCPCGCHEVGNVPVKAGYGGNPWTWDGDEVAPTLRPSVLRIGGCKWHGWMTKGMFVSC